MKQGQDRPRSSQHQAMSNKAEEDVHTTRGRNVHALAALFGMSVSSVHAVVKTAHDAVTGAFAALFRVPMAYGRL